MNITMLRSAIETLAPATALICVVSAVSREAISPERLRSKKSMPSAGEMAEDIGAQVGDDPLAKPGDEIEAQAGGQPPARATTPISADEIAVDRAGIVGVEAMVDHAAHGQRHGQRRERRRDERERRRRPVAACSAAHRAAASRSGRSDAAGALGPRLGLPVVAARQSASISVQADAAIWAVSCMPRSFAVSRQCGLLCRPGGVGYIVAPTETAASSAAVLSH